MNKLKDFNQVAYKNQFIKNKYDRINLTVPKGDKNRIKAAAKGKGMSVNEFIKTCINEQIKKE